MEIARLNYGDVFQFEDQQGSLGQKYMKIRDGRNLSTEQLYVDERMQLFFCDWNTKVIFMNKSIISDGYLM